MPLPVPEIPEDVVIQHSYKQFRRNDTNRLRPPKLRPAIKRLNDAFNRSNSFMSNSTAHAISFRSNGDSISGEPERLPLSSSHNTDSNATYFEKEFQCILKIGEGSFGEVFKVRSREDKKLYAVKKSKLVRGSNYRQERLEEVRRYEQFSGHENCVKFYRAWEQDDRLYMQMELCRESLETYLQRNRNLPEPKMWIILSDLLLAVKSLHDRNLIHLDIKLDNVLVCDDDCFKLGDFGLVTDVDKIAYNIHITEGDSRYMAPEVMQGVFTKAADIFSLGIAMLELACCLELPSNGPLWHELRSGYLPQEFVKYLSDDLLELIRHMMSPDPNARPTVDQILHHRIVAAIRNERQRWKFLRKLNLAVRRTRTAAWQHLCNLKMLILQIFTTLLTVVKADKLLKSSNFGNGQNRGDCTPARVNALPSIRTHIISSTPTVANDYYDNDFMLGDDSLLYGWRESTPDNCRDASTINSTPINWNSTQYSSLAATGSDHKSNCGCRVRKEIQRPLFRNENDDGDENISRRDRSNSLGVEEIDHLNRTGSSDEGNEQEQGKEQDALRTLLRSYHEDQEICSGGGGTAPLKGKRLFADLDP